MYFYRTINELGIKKPDFEVCARAYIGLLANRIKQVNDYTEIFNLADVIFQIVAMEIDSSDDLSVWLKLVK